jgi:hypothetical protein
MKKQLTLALDVGIGVALAGALLVVYALDRRPPPDPSGGGTADPDRALKINVLYGESPRSEAQAPPPPKPLRLAVTPRQYDDIGKLLSELGKGYQYQDVSLEVLKNPSRAGEFDVVFFTCASEDKPDPDLRNGLRHFVANGGTLYASDLRFGALGGAFPEFLDPEAARNPAGTGKQTVSAGVVDPGLREHLGKPRIDLYFDLDGWRPAWFRRDKITTYLEGSFRTPQGMMEGPLMTRFRHERGTVIFTSFHNAANSAVGSQLLRYLVFTAVTSKVESKVTQTMIESGFAPKQSSLITVASGVPSVTKTYTSKKAGKLRFALGFNPENAQLRLTVRSPDGRSASAEHTSSFTIEVPQALAGEWSYTVTAVKVPYPNFPFRVTVGEEG